MQPAPDSSTSRPPGEGDQPRRRSGWVMVLVLCLLAPAPGLFLLGWGMHTIDVRLGRTLFELGRIAGMLGFLVSLLLIYFQSTRNR